MICAKRAASGLSPEELSILDARIEGQIAGKKGSAAGLNPWQAGTPQHDAWERGRSAGEAYNLYGRFV